MATLRVGFRVQTVGTEKRRTGVIVKRGTGRSWVVQWDAGGLPSQIGESKIEREAYPASKAVPDYDEWMEEL